MLLTPLGRTSPFENSRRVRSGLVLELTAADRRCRGIVAGILAMAAVLLLGVGVACGTTEPTATLVRPPPTFRRS